jgi:hypothetical protein
MSLEGDLEAIKPNYKTVGSLDFLSKYKTDLDYLKNAKRVIEQYISEKNIDDEETNKRLKKINKAILKLEMAINDFEKNLEKGLQQ